MLSCALQAQKIMNDRCDSNTRQCTCKAWTSVTGGTNASQGAEGRQKRASQICSTDRLRRKVATRLTKTYPVSHLPLILTLPKHPLDRAHGLLEQHVACPTSPSAVCLLVHRTKLAHPRGVDRVLRLRLHLRGQDQDYDTPHDEPQICQ